MLGAHVNWWRLGDLLGLHPQAAYEKYGQHREGLRSPAEQHPELDTVLVTAGLAAEHNWGDEYGIDIEDLGIEHSLAADPTVAAMRQAAQLRGDDVWIAERLPGEYEGDRDADDDQVIKQWTTVVLGPDEQRRALFIEVGQAGVPPLMEAPARSGPNPAKRSLRSQAGGSGVSTPFRWRAGRASGTAS